MPLRVHWPQGSPWVQPVLHHVIEPQERPATVSKEPLTSVTHLPLRNTSESHVLKDKDKAQHPNVFPPSLHIPLLCVHQMPASLSNLMYRLSCALPLPVGRQLMTRSLASPLPLPSTLGPDSTCAVSCLLDLNVPWASWPHVQKVTCDTLPPASALSAVPTETLGSSPSSGTTALGTSRVRLLVRVQFHFTRGLVPLPKKALEGGNGPLGTAPAIHSCQALTLTPGTGSVVGSLRPLSSVVLAQLSSLDNHSSHVTGIIQQM